MLLSAWYVFFVINGATFVVCSAEPLLWRPSSDLETGKDPICCVDTEWEGRMFIDWATVFIDQNTAFAYINGTVHLGYSISRKKVFMYIDGVEQSPLIPHPVPSISTVLYDFGNGIMYNVANGDCQKSDLPKTMPLQCVPGSAKPISTGTIGPEPISTYKYTKDADDVPWDVRASVVIKEEAVGQKVCSPVLVSYFTPSANPDSGSLYTLTFTDTGPITNTTIFDVPQQCK